MNQPRKTSFANEAEIQQWLKEMLKKNNGAFKTQICNSSYLEDFRPNGYAEEKFVESYNLAWAALTYVQIVTEDTDISLSKNEVLRPDFILYDQEMESIIIVELKNRAQATREAGTEIGAYAAAIRNYMPLLADSDIVNVIVSSTWPPLLKHFIFNEIVWLGRSIICIEAFVENGRRQLRIKDIRSFTDGKRAAQIPQDALGGHIIGLEHLIRPGESIARLKSQMRLAGMAMARKGTALRGHGFAFLWETDNPNVPYCFTLVNAAPFLDLGHLIVGVPPYSFVNPFAKKLHHLVQDYDPGGHTRSLSLIDKQARMFLKINGTFTSELYCDWKSLKKDIRKHQVKMLGFYPWGIFADAFHRALAQRISEGKNVTHDHCKTGWKTISQLVASS